MKSTNFYKNSVKRSLKRKEQKMINDVNNSVAISVQALEEIELSEQELRTIELSTEREKLRIKTEINNEQIKLKDLKESLEKIVDNSEIDLNKYKEVSIDVCISESNIELLNELLKVQFTEVDEKE